MRIQLVGICLAFSLLVFLTILAHYTTQEIKHPYDENIPDWWA